MYRHRAQVFFITVMIFNGDCFAKSKGWENKCYCSKKWPLYSPGETRRVLRFVLDVCYGKLVVVPRTLLFNFARLVFSSLILCQYRFNCRVLVFYLVNNFSSTLDAFCLISNVLCHQFRIQMKHFRLHNEAFLIPFYSKWLIKYNIYFLNWVSLNFCA